MSLDFDPSPVPFAGSLLSTDTSLNDASLASVRLTATWILVSL